jgi:hypothetical protein
MHAAVEHLSTSDEDLGVPDEDVFDWRRTYEEADAAVMTYRRLLRKYGLSKLYTLEVEHVGRYRWVIHMNFATTPQAPGSPSQPADPPPAVRYPAAAVSLHAG